MILFIPECSSDSAGPRRGSQGIHIALVGMGKDHQSWAVLQNTVRQITSLNNHIKVDILAPDSASPRGQQEILAQLATTTIDAVCIQPVDSRAIAPAIDVFATKGVPVITLGADVPSSARTIYCGPIEAEVGEAAASACPPLVTGQSNSIILLHAGPEDSYYGGRYAGFKLGLSRTRGVALMREVNCHGNRIEALELMKSESRRYPRVAAWVLLDDWPLRVAQESDRLVSGESGVVVCNSDPAYFKRLHEGRIDALIGYDFRQAVQESIFAAIRACEDRGKGQFVKEISIAPEVITRNNLAIWEARWQAWQSGQSPPPMTSHLP